jgi:aminoglycoside 3-N-acetyltransferase
MTLSMASLVRALGELGIGQGDIVHVQSDLRRVGLVDAPLSRDSVCSFYVQALRHVVGEEGTITCCTAFEDYGRYGTPFIREQSPSRTDTLSEYIRKLPGAVRSIHPILSVTGIGARADELCGGPHYEGFGWQSPWGRLHRANAKILTLGLSAELGGTTFFHYVERLYGVPYVYTKIFSAPVISGGRQLDGPFTMSVRYLDFDIENTPVRVKTSMLANGLARQVPVGRARSWCADAQDVVAHMSSLFDVDRWVMLKSPPKFRPGIPPMDGPTGPLRLAADPGETG